MATRISGKIAGLDLTRGGVQVILDNDPNAGPKDNFFLLKRDHENYNALYSFVLAAFANRWNFVIWIEGDGEIDPNVNAAIRRIGINAQ